MGVTIEHNRTVQYEGVIIYFKKQLVEITIYNTICCLLASDRSYTRKELHGTTGGSNYLLKKHLVEVTVGNNCTIQNEGVIICLLASSESHNRKQLQGSTGRSNCLFKKHMMGVTIEHNCTVQYEGVIICFKNIW